MHIDTMIFTHILKQTVQRGIINQSNNDIIEEIQSKHYSAQKAGIVEIKRKVYRIYIIQLLSECGTELKKLGERHVMYTCCVIIYQSRFKKKNIISLNDFVKTITIIWMTKGLLGFKSH